MAGGQDIDGVLEKLVKDVEAAVHALYRGEVRQLTAKARTDTLLKAARQRLAELIPSAQGPAGAAVPAGGVTSPRPSVAAPVVAGAAAGWSREEGEAVLRCIMAWLPVGPPTTADPGSKCIPAGRELVPTWGQRERAREAVRRISQASSQGNT
jgi:hypothetical protein